MEDTVSVSYPCFVITTHPFRFDEGGRQILEETMFQKVDSDDGTAFLLLFRKKALLSRYLWETDGAGFSLCMDVNTPQELRSLVQILQKRTRYPVGILVDPDGDNQGFPIPPEEAAK